MSKQLYTNLFSIDAQTVEHMLPRLSDPEAETRADAAYTLGHCPDGRAVEPLIAALDDPKPVVRERAALALGLLGDRRAVPPLIDRLGRDDAGLRVQAAQALGRIASPQALGALSVALGDANKTVRSCAAEALGLIGQYGRSGGSSACERPLDAAGQRAGEQDTIPGEPIMPPDLGTFEPSALEAAVEPLAAALRDEDPLTRIKAAEALGRIGSRSALPALIAALEDQALADTAASSLGELGDPAAIEPLLAYIRSRRQARPHAAAQALGKLGAPAFNALMQGLKDPAPMLRFGCCIALGMMGDRRALPALQELAANDHAAAGTQAKVSSAASKAIRRIVEPRKKPE